MFSIRKKCLHTIPPSRHFTNMTQVSKTSLLFPVFSACNRNISSSSPCSHHQSVLYRDPTWLTTTRKYTHWFLVWELCFAFWDGSGNLWLDLVGFSHNTTFTSLVRFNSGMQSRAKSIDCKFWARHSCWDGLLNLLKYSLRWGLFWKTPPPRHAKLRV